MEILEVKNFSFAYPNTEKPALEHISFSVGEGDFIILCGASGCGKSTLLKNIKPELAPHGKHAGEINFHGKPLPEETGAAGGIGYVMQNPEAQIVTDKVWHELAFGLENLGIPTAEIRSRVAEMANYFGIHTWFRKKTSELSGGQKQLLNLASVMLMDPDLLILDEPTGQLDPIAAKEFIEAVVKINRELGITIILAEHNLEEAYAFSTRIMLMEEGKLSAFLPPPEMAKELAKSRREGMFMALPASVRISESAGAGDFCPLTVAEGKNWAEGFFSGKEIPEFKLEEKPRPEEKAIELEEVWFQYEKGAEPVLRDLSMDIRKGEIYALLGGNGSGKTTTLSAVSGKLKAGSGKICINGKELKKYSSEELFSGLMAVLPQNPQSIFVETTLRGDLLEILDDKKLKKEEKQKTIEEIAEKFGIAHLLERHPYDLSGGEMQKAALAKIMLLEPEILLLDEPTKGLDALSKKNIGGILQRLRDERGVTVFFVTHDLDFCAEFADRCALFFDGYIVSEGEKHSFFAKNRFYTTAANRIMRGISPRAITCGEGVELCRKALESSV